MKNFPIKHEGKEYWISRAVGVVGMIYFNELNTLTYNDVINTYILANKRGQGAPDFKGYWNCPCGYLDFDESGEEAISRETYEETGVKINPYSFHLVGVNTDPKANKQNIALRYKHVTNYYNNIDDILTTRFSEKNEVEEIKLINIKDIGKYEWAFGHDNLILEYWGVQNVHRY